MLLLVHGADPNIATPKKMSPLLYAAEALNPTCIKPLLDHGADIHATDHDLARHNSLHIACAYHDDIAYLEPLRDAGISIDAKTNYSYTPLMAAVCQNSVNACRYLLDHGADINARGQYGKVPVMYTIEYNSHACLGLFLARSADCTMEYENGPTIAHFAARYADIETMSILNSAHLEHISLDRLEMEGPDELMIPQSITKRMRDGECISEDFTAAFDTFIKKVVNPRGVDSHEDTQDRVSEVYEDALEEQTEEECNS